MNKLILLIGIVMVLVIIVFLFTPNYSEEVSDYSTYPVEKVNFTTKAEYYIQYDIQNRPD